MAKKRIFQILDEMNQQDIQNGTQLVTLHPDIINLQRKKNGLHITMGIPDGLIKIGDYAFGEEPPKRVVLMIVDGAEFDKRNS